MRPAATAVLASMTAARSCGGRARAGGDPRNKQRYVYRPPVERSDVHAPGSGNRTFKGDPDIGRAAADQGCILTFGDGRSGLPSTC